MTLKNYWWLLIWMLIIGGLTWIYPPQREEMVLGRKRYRWNRLSAAILAAPYVIWAAWRTNNYGDTSQYRSTFLKMPTGLSNMVSYVASRSKGKAFVTFEYLFKTLVSKSDIAFFFIIALIQIFFLVHIFRKYSRSYWLSFFFFIASTDYMSWVHNGIRQFVAVTLILACLPLIIKKKYFLMCLVVAAATFIHSTALFVLPFIFIVNGRAWNGRTILYIIALIISILFVDKVTNFLVKAMEDTAYEGDIEILLNDDGTNILRVFFYAVPTVMSWLFRAYIDRADDPFINMCVNLSIISTGIYILSYFTSGILVGAVPIYFSLTNYILIPWLIKEVFDPASAFAVEAGFVGVYCIFFYYQMGPTWGLL